MEISDKLHCLYTATVERRDGSYVVEIPQREVEKGALEAGETFRVAMLPSSAPGSEGKSGSDSRSASGSDPGKSDASSRDASDGRSGRTPAPPVEEGETRTVEIENIGDQGDGITRVERGFVVIVPGTDQGERVRVEITEVRENVAFAEVQERLSYYE
jgi:predicted RNA-binding protein with TRAM domain